MTTSWRQYAQRTKSLEDKYTPVLIRLITKFRKQFIAHYKQDPHSSVSALQQQAMHEDILKLVQSIYKVAGLMGANMANDEIKKAATIKAAGFGRNERWIADVINFLKLHMLGFVSNITETMREDILKVLEKAVEEGWGIDRTVIELQKSNLIEARARVIARTEINRAANVGHTIAARSLPYEVDKKWVAAHDHRTRSSHRHIDAHQVSEDGFFEVEIYKGDKPTGQTEQMAYPGDPNASAGNTINCRCRVIYIPKRDAQGRLILRDRNQATIIPLRRPQQIPAHQIAAILKENIYIGIEK